MGTPLLNTRRRSLAMERTGQWVFSQEIPTDIIVQVREATFSLHKFMLVAKSNYIRKLILESQDPDLARIDLSDIPGGSATFEKAAKFCYGVNFEITVHNVAALQCAAEYLQMTDKYCENNLANRTDDFLNQVALSSLSGAIIVLKTCEDLLPMVLDLNIIQRCVDVISSKACSEASFPSRTPPNWWTEELSILDIASFQKVLAAMRSRGAKTLTVSGAIITYAERSLRDLVRDHSGNGIKSSDSVDFEFRAQQRELLESIIALLPSEKAAFPINFLCSLLRCAIFLKASSSAKNELEKRISAILEHVTVDDLLVLSFTYDGESLFDLESVRRAHPNLDEIEREKVCSAMDPLKLSYEARIHASQNKRLPVQIVLHALYYDQLQLRSGANDSNLPVALATRSQLPADVSLVKENEALRTELMKMKMYISDLQRNQGTSSRASSGPSKKSTFFSSMSKTLGKLNPFKHGSKDTSNLDDGVDITKPRRRRFSIS
ncbi:hypothetical protein Cgig2_014057 [Carnegiea gigantea]|uniref:Root phototropism protein 2 n=1 Tax=Carnegiea gigantea TaxID=171969 RepID=A0A9Q1KYA8_9CARY|nr:hypothetical protein Cgig2_013600 [Carnegiea gigantea]KAJ8451285.1 hypothetical protein Cgig2_014057 [Carnegiea gigantea]